MSIALALAWVVVLILARTLTHSWWAPATVMTLSVTLSVAGSLVLAPEFTQSTEANLFLMGACLLAVAGHTLGSSLMSNTSERREPTAFPLTPSLISLGFASSAVSAYYALRSLGLDPSVYLSIERLLSAAQAATRLRYVQGLDLPIAYNIANSVLLGYAIVVATHIGATGKVRAIALAPIAIYCMPLLLTTMRANLLFVALLMAFAAAFARQAAATTDGRGAAPHLSRAWALGGAALVLTAIYAMQVLRYGPENTRTSEEVWAHLKVWPFGGPSAFSTWFAESSGAISGHIPGFYTFMGIVDNLGIEDRVIGGYDVNVDIGNGAVTNVYTAFRGLILDFSPAGALVLCALLGVGGAATLASARMPFGVVMPTYVLLASFAAFSPYASFWAFTSNIVGAALAPIMIRGLCLSRSQIQRPKRTHFDPKARRYSRRVQLLPRRDEPPEYAASTPEGGFDYRGRQHRAMPPSRH